jgi:nicotinamide-nucleotide amidase
MTGRRCVVESDDPRLEREIGDLLAARGWTLGVAESCTGGLIGHRLTRVAGASAFFRGGVIAYANEVKTRLLGVPEELLARKGAVSAETAGRMAEGARAALGADAGLGITGIMGPGGGTAEKPVGLVFIGVCLGGRTTVRCVRNEGSRDELKWRSSDLALGLLRDALKQTGELE